MADVTVALKISAPADAVWDILGDFDSMPKWMPGIETSEVSGEGVGAIRTVTSARVGTIKERLDAYDSTARSFAYSVLEGALPANNFSGRMQVVPEGEGACTIHWSCNFEPKDGPEDEVKERFAGIFQRSLENLAQVVGG
jgi:carbon monoxide dehydrogenase subunit G